MKHDISERESQWFSFIETQLAWTGCIHAGEAAEYFHTARQTAQGFIKAYQEKFPSQMEYDPHKKRHIKTTDFTCHITEDEPHRFLDFVRGQALEGRFWQNDPAMDFLIADADIFGRPRLSGEILREIISAMACRKRMEIRYHKKAGALDSLKWRTVSPNRLVYTDQRYHLRGFCETRQDYRDFVLSRIVEAKMLDDERPEEHWVSSFEDRAWQTPVTLRFTPNPNLDEDRKRAVSEGYDLDSEGRLRIETNEALAYYVRRRLCAPDSELAIAKWVEL
ncbi:WYL domain-containing protein [Desulfatibacillum aliphaticivorans]|uniref:WYL domain-containing protein n=1 Tax=Desulfatibacillum aliphaticivorans TaxID=218208 RepID=UPI0003FC4847|nr:WYL domain-containing protein [Desulfatibacillum aliphaticivorans]